MKPMAFNNAIGVSTLHKAQSNYLPQTKNSHQVMTLEKPCFFAKEVYKAIYTNILRTQTV